MEAYEAMPLREALGALEKRPIERALERAGGNRAEAARILGIARPQLYTKMEEHGIGGRGKPGGGLTARAGRRVGLDAGAARGPRPLADRASDRH